MLAVMESLGKRGKDSRMLEEIFVGVANVSQEIHDIAGAISENTKAVVGSARYLGDEIRSLGAVVYEADTASRYGMESVKGAVEGTTQAVRAVFDMIDRMREILASPQGTQFQEWRKLAHEYYRNGWLEESESAIGSAIDLKIVDPGIHFLKGLISLEERKEYEIAEEAFKKAVRYSKPNGGMGYAASLQKLATTEHVLGKFREAFEHQNEAVSIRSNPMWEFDLSRYAALVDDRTVFRESALSALRADRMFLGRYLSEDDFRKKWISKVLDEIIGILRDEDSVRRQEEEKRAIAAQRERDRIGRIREMLEGIAVLSNEIKRLEAIQREEEEKQSWI